MKTAAKVIAYIIGLFIILLIIAAIILKTTVNPNDYKAKFSHLVEQKTGLKLNINGDIKLSFFPWLGLDVQKVELLSSDMFHNTPMLSVDDAAVRLKLLPLIVGDVRINTITLNKPVINLITNTQGRHNWQLTPAAAKTTASNSTSTTRPPHANKKKEDDDLNLSIANIDIKQGSAHVINQQNGQRIDLTALNFSGSDINLDGQPFSMNTSFLFSQSQPVLKFQAKLDTTLSYNQSHGSTQIEGLKLSGQLLSVDRKLNKPISFSSNIDQLIINADQTSVDSLYASIDNLKLNAKLHVVKQADNDKQMNGSIEIPSFNPSQLSQALGLDSQHTKGIKQASVNIQFKSSKGIVTFSPFIIKLDDHSITAHAKYQPAPKNHLQFAIKADQLNLDQLIPADGPATADKAVKQQQAVARASQRHPATSQSTKTETPWYATNWDGRIDVGQLTVNHMTFNQLHIKTQNNNGHINLAPITAKLYQGQLNGLASMNASKLPASYGLNVSVTDVNIGQLMHSQTRKNVMDGLGNFSLQIKTRGADNNALVRNLNGNGELLVKQGKLFGFNLDSLVNQAARFLNQGKVSKPKLKTGNETDFNQLSGNFTIRNGVIFNNDLRLVASQAMAGGSGQINLVNQTINYQMNVGPKAASTKQQAWNFPLTIQGPLDHPKITPNVAKIIGEVLKQVIKDETKKTGDKINQFIKGLFN